MCHEPLLPPHVDCVHLPKKAEVNKAQPEPTGLGLTPQCGSGSPVWAWLPSVGLAPQCGPGSIADMQQTLALLQRAERLWKALSAISLSSQT